MSKYDELKDRIEVNKRSELGWGKEFDDILWEMGGKDNKYYWIRIGNERNDSVRITDYTGKTLESFHYNSQCEKNTTLHDAALWLLDNSSIKKDEKKEQIKDIQDQINKLQDQINHINGCQYD